jgi:multimeric flavodoxin WrbA
MKQDTIMQAGNRLGKGEHTKKVTVFVGSAHKGGATYTAACRFLEDLESFDDVHGEIIVLSDYNIGVCRGCKTCFDRGEERCPLKDDRDVLIEKMMASDGVVFASPNYSFQVSAVMKIFLDRLGFLFHRPRFHGKTCAAIVVQGIGGGSKIVKYLQFVGGGLGFNVVKGSCIRTLEPMDQNALDRMDRTLAKQSGRFHARLLRPTLPAPSLFWLMIFRMTRTGLKLMAGEEMRDFVYYRDKGLFESDYYYPTHLGPFKRAAGAFFDWAAARMFRQPEVGDRDLISVGPAKLQKAKGA